MPVRPALLLPFLLLAPARAGVMESYKPELFESLQRKERTIILHFYSLSCNVCAAQEKTLESLLGEPGRQTPAGLQADFESAEELRRLYSVTAPSTLLIFRGTRLIGRSVGLLTDDEIGAFLRDSRARSRAQPRPRARRSYRPKR